MLFVDFESKLKSVDFEGYTNYFYVDTKEAKKITIGCGIMFETVSAVFSSGLRFYFKDNPTKEAKQEEIEKEFNSIKTCGCLSYSCKNWAKLQADESGLNTLFNKRLSKASSEAKVFFESGNSDGTTMYKHFEELPPDVRFALIDMSYNLGLPKLKKYQHLLAALKKGDWETAAKESHRHGPNATRNNEIAKWIRRSIKAPSQNDTTNRLP